MRCRAAPRREETKHENDCQREGRKTGHIAERARAIAARLAGVAVEIVHVARVAALVQAPRIVASQFRKVGGVFAQAAGVPRPVGDHRERQPVGDRQETGVELHDALVAESAASLGIGFPGERRLELDVVEDLARMLVERRAYRLDQHLGDALDALAVIVERVCLRQCHATRRYGEQQRSGYAAPQHGTILPVFGSRSNRCAPVSQVSESPAHPADIRPARHGRSTKGLWLRAARFRSL